jgi:hypothetical protein
MRHFAARVLINQIVRLLSVASLLVAYLGEVAYFIEEVINAVQVSQ